jgi:2,4-diaminopentanoate dehydrogenase
VSAPIRVAVWGTGNVGRAAIRMVDGHPELELAAVIVSSEKKAGVDAGELAMLGRPTGVAATLDADDVLGRVDAVAYCASADFRPEEAMADILKALSAGCSVVTPSHYALYDPPSAPAELRQPFEDACREGGSAFLAQGVDPGWINDVFPLLMTGFVSEFSEVRAIEIFDYSAYEAEDAVRELIGFGKPMDYLPVMIAPTVPTMIWGGQLRIMARALGLELDDIVEHVERLPLERTVTTALGEFEEGMQGAIRFEVRGMVDGKAALVVEHVTRITPDIAPDWPKPPEGAAGAHVVKVEGRPRIEVMLEAEDEDGNRAAGGNATAAARIIDAIPFLVSAEPGLYDALSVPLRYGKGRYRAV